MNKLARRALGLVVVLGLLMSLAWINRAELILTGFEILADDLGWNDLTFGGGGVAGGTAPTPNIDSIAAEGANFVNGYAANGTC